MNVGKVIEGSKAYKGKNVYTLFPHQTLYSLKESEVVEIPKFNKIPDNPTINFEKLIHEISLLLSENKKSHQLQGLKKQFQNHNIL